MTSGDPVDGRSAAPAEEATSGSDPSGAPKADDKSPSNLVSDEADAASERRRTVKRVTEREAISAATVPRTQNLFHRLTGRVAREQDPLRDRLTARADITEIPFRRLGFRIFVAVLILVGVMILAISAFVTLTYPRISDVHSLLGQQATGPDVLKAWRDTRAEWVAQVTSVGQLFLFGSVLPLLGTIVGYVLGERRAGAGGQTADS